MPERAPLWAAGWDPIICVCVYLEFGTDGCRDMEAEATRVGRSHSFPLDSAVGEVASWDRTEQENNLTYTPHVFRPCALLPHVVDLPR